MAPAALSSEKACTPSAPANQCLFTPHPPRLALLGPGEGGEAWARRPESGGSEAGRAPSLLGLYTGQGAGGWGVWRARKAGPGHKGKAGEACRRHLSRSGGGGLLCRATVGAKAPRVQGVLSQLPGRPGCRVAVWTVRGEAGSAGRGGGQVLCVPGGHVGGQGCTLEYLGRPWGISNRMQARGE